MTTKRNDNYIDEIHNHCIDIQNDTIFLHGDGGDSDDIDILSSYRFIKNMHILEKKSSCTKINIELSSGGGDIDYAFAIFDRIASSTKHVTITCAGCCMSAGTLILQAADTRASLPNCTFMIHQGYEYIDSTHKQTKSWTKHYDDMQKKMFDIYTTKMCKAKYFEKYTINKVKTFLRNKFNTKEDWIIFPDEALTYGLIDKIIEY